METIKSVLGFGTAPQEGREPVSGVTGSGVAGEPYDQGNAEDSTLGGKAAQHTDTTADSTTASSTEPYTIGSGLGPNSTTTTGNTSSGITSSDGVTPNAASATSPSGPAVDPTSSNTTSGPHSSDLANKTDPRVDSDNDRTTSGPHSSDAANKVDPRVDSDNSKTGSTGPIGGSSWMSTALPHREAKDNTTSNTAVSGTTTQQPSHSNEHTGLEDIKSQPPNVLPTNVPTGTSTDFGSPDSTTSGVTGTSSAAATSSVPSSSTNTTTKIPDETVGSSAPSTAEPSHSLTGSRSSITPEKPDYTDSPLKPAEKGSAHAVNPDAIPLAGGKKIGEDAYVERKSMQVDSIDAGLPATTSSNNTARNVGTAEATGRPSTTLSEPEQPNVTSGSSGSEHKEKKSLKEKIKEKVHIHKHDK